MADTLTPDTRTDEAQRDAQRSDPAALERDLNETRSRLDRDLTQLQERLSPGQVLDDVLTYFRGADGTDFGRRLMDGIRANPMPVVLTGVGVAWMMASRPRGGSEAGGEPAANGHRASLADADYSMMILEVREAEQGLLRGPDEDDRSFSQRLDEVRGKAMGLTRDAKETADAFAQRVKDALAKAEAALSKAREKAGALGQSAQDAAQGAQRYAADTLSKGREVASDALSRGKEAGGRLVDAVTDDPVLLAALGIAAGALVGALLPVSDKEEEALGAAAARTRETAKALAREGLERGRHIAEAVVEQGKQSAQAHGLAGGRTPGQLVDAALSGELAHDAKAVAHDVLEAGQQAVRQEAETVAAPQPSPTTNPVGQPVG